MPEEILEMADGQQLEPQIQEIPQQPEDPPAQLQVEPQADPQGSMSAAEEARPEKNRLATLLTILILLCLIAEVTLASYIGLTLYRNAQNQRVMTAQYEAYLTRQSELQSNPPKVQYIGPTVRVVDGVVVDNYAAAEFARAQAEGNIPGI